MLNKICIAALLIANAAWVQGAAAAEEHTDRTVRFKQIDKNGDGKLALLEFQTRPSSEEAKAGKPAAPVAPKEMAARAERFKQLDKNGDGFLSFAEFEATLTTPQPTAK